MRFAKGLGAVALAVLAASGAWEVWSQRSQAEHTAHLQRRPWLVFWQATDGPGNSVLVWIRNIGNTPALDIENAACAFVGPSRPAPGTTCPPVSRPRLATMGPGAEVSIGIEGVVAPDRATDGSGADRVWILASVDYGDAFGHRHRNRFCFRRAVEPQAWLACSGPSDYD